MPPPFELISGARQHALDGLYGFPGAPCHLLSTAVFPIPPEQYRAVRLGKLFEHSFRLAFETVPIEVFVDQRLDRQLRVRLSFLVSQGLRFTKTGPVVVLYFVPRDT